MDAETVGEAAGVITGTEISIVVKEEDLTDEANATQDRHHLVDVTPGNEIRSELLEMLTHTFLEVGLAEGLWIVIVVDYLFLSRHQRQCPGQIQTTHGVSDVALPPDLGPRPLAVADHHLQTREATHIGAVVEEED